MIILNILFIPHRFLPLSSKMLQFIIMWVVLGLTNKSQDIMVLGQDIVKKYNNLRSETSSSASAGGDHEAPTHPSPVAFNSASKGRVRKKKRQKNKLKKNQKKQGKEQKMEPSNGSTSVLVEEPSNVPSILVEVSSRCNDTLFSNFTWNDDDNATVYDDPIYN